jgi:molybdenum cofactor cytidylyltransferase
MSGPGWSLPGALDIGAKELVALVGGGGKTSLMFSLAGALPGRVVITTTTRIFAAQMALAPAVCSAADLAPLGDHLDTFGRCLVIGEVGGEKAAGVDPALPAHLLERPDVDVVLVEADGSRMRPVKAPAGHEPVLPPGTTLLVPVAGLDALDAPLETVAHRPELVRQVLAAAESLGATVIEDDRLTAAGLARLLVDPQGGRKAQPAGARLIPFINKIETAEQLSVARRVAQDILRLAADVPRVVLGAVRTPQPVREVWRRVGGIVLAAGMSERMGRNKLLLPWGDRTVLEETVAHAAAADLAGLVVVTGHEADEIRGLAGLAEVARLHNPGYAQGMLSSVQTAVREAPTSWSAVLVLLGDQPMVDTGIINQILATYAGSPAGLVVPRHNGRRGNPVLIDRRHFAELLALPPGEAPRTLLSRHPNDIAWVDLSTDAVLRDLDRPEAYERWRPRGASPD